MSDVPAMAFCGVGWAFTIIGVAASASLGNKYDPLIAVAFAFFICSTIASLIESEKFKITRKEEQS